MTEMDSAASPRGGQPTWTRENRIRANHHLLATLAALWDAHPDQRFGQLVMNLSRDDDGFADTWEWGHGRWREAIEKTARAWPSAPGTGASSSPSTPNSSSRGDA